MAPPSSSNIERFSHFFLSLENSSDVRHHPKVSFTDQKKLLEFFNIHQNPFANICGTESGLRNTPWHLSAFQKLQQCITEKLPIGVLIAQNGMGRGTALQRLIATLSPKKHRPIKITAEAGMSENNFIKTVLYELGVTDIFRKNSTMHHLTRTLRQSVAKQCARKNVRLIFCIEEAHNLSLKVFSFLQWLLNIEASEKKLVTIFLFGDLSLGERLQQKGMEFLTSRIYVSVRLPPLTLGETEDYLHYQLAQVNSKEEIFSPAAAQMIFSATGGICREINAVAHNAMIRAFELKSRTIDKTVLLSCLGDCHS